MDPLTVSAKRRIGLALDAAEQAISDARNKRPQSIGYRPYAVDAFLERLASFDAAVAFSMESSAMSPIMFAMHGWQVDRPLQKLICLLCEGVIYPRPLSESPATHAALINRYAAMAVQMHESTCLWRKPCNESVLVYPHPTPTLVKHRVDECLTNYIKHQELLTGLFVENVCMLEDDEIKHLVCQRLYYMSIVAQLNMTRNILTFTLTGWRFREITNENNLSKSTQLDTLYLQCEFCQRKFGLWSLKDGDGSFDPLQHHSWWCLYIVDQEKLIEKDPIFSTRFNQSNLTTIIVPWWKNALEILRGTLLYKICDIHNYIAEQYKEFPSVSEVSSLLYTQTVFEPLVTRTNGSNHSSSNNR